MMERILLVEDDLMIADSLGTFLRQEGFLTACATGQKAAEECLDEGGFDLVLLDISLKDGNGFSLCKKIREQYQVPVIFLTASGDEYSVVTGLELGAEDYIRKPFRPRELLSRIRVVLRRGGKRPSVYDFYGIRVDADKASVSKDGKEIVLSALEYRLLLIFCQNKGNVVKRGKLLAELWDVGGDFVNDNTLTVYIKRLREKIEDDPAQPERIKTVRGIGYRA
jgi:DNA-binding response OmpR family regulator